MDPGMVAAAPPKRARPQVPAKKDTPVDPSTAPPDSD
jgi:hypothetical protein